MVKKKSDFSIFSPSFCFTQSKIWFQYCSKSTLRPILEYASIVCSPSKICLINRIESIQKRYIKIVLLKIDYVKYYNYSYEQRIKAFQLDTLQHRPLFIDLLECFKILKCKHCDPLYAAFFPTSAPSSSRRGISFKYPRYLSDLTFNCFHNCSRMEFPSS